MMRGNSLLAALAIGVCLFVSPAASQMTCARTDTPASFRAESIAELLPDVVLQCTGGTPTPAGTPIPQFQVLLTANSNFTSRSLYKPAGASWSWSEALLMLDDPGPQAQLPCAVSAFDGSCPAIAGNGMPNNVFQGQLLQANTIAFQSIPIDPPGPNGTRTIRIVNLRADMTGLPPNLQMPGPQATVRMFTAQGASVTISNSDQFSGLTNPGMVFSVQTANDTPPSNLLPALTITPSVLASTTAPDFSKAFHVKFSEGFAGAFRRRNVGTSSANPQLLVNQPIPGLNYGAETGFYNGLFPVLNNFDLAGLSDSGTRLKLTISGIPAGVLVWVSVNDVQPGTTNYSAAAPKALLEYSDSGALNPVTTNITNGFFQLNPNQGTAQAIWEVVRTDPSSIEDFSFAVALTIDPAAKVPAALGAATASGTLAPTATDRGDGTPPIPHFLEKLVPLPAFAVKADSSANSFVTVNAASYSGAAIAPGSVASLFASSPVFSATGTTLSLVDAHGNSLAESILAVGPSQINFLVDPSTSSGIGAITATSGGRVVGSSLVAIAPVAPGIFAANADGKGVPAGSYQTINGAASNFQLMGSYDATQQTWSPVPIDLGGGGTLVFLNFYGTGIRSRSSLSGIVVSLGGTPAPVVFAGSQGTPGVDLLIAGPVPQTLRGKGQISVLISVDGVQANPTMLVFQ